MVSRNLRFQFSLVSYNILSQSLLNDHSHLYTNCSPRDLEWPRRGNRIVRELINDRADIICLQEVESEHLQSLYRPRLAHYGYECLYKKKTGFKPDGCAIFYKSKLFHLTNSKGVEFNRTDIAYLLNRDNVGLIAVLKPRMSTRSESSHLVIANTHLIFNPRRADVKLAQLKYFLSELETISRKFCDTTERTANNARTNQESPHQDADPSSYHPTILCGDLNSTPDSDVPTYILKNSRPVDRLVDSQSPGSPRGRDRDNSEQTDASSSQDDEQSRQSPLASAVERLARARLSNDNSCETGNQTDMADYDHSLLFKSAYPTRNRFGHRYVSTFSSDIVDYIFYTPKLRLESSKELLTEQQLDDIRPMPNSRFPSDHISLAAEFSLS